MILKLKKSKQKNINFDLNARFVVVNVEDSGIVEEDDSVEELEADFFDEDLEVIGLPVFGLMLVIVEVFKVIAEPLLVWPDALAIVGRGACEYGWGTAVDNSWAGPFGVWIICTIEVEPVVATFAPVPAIEAMVGVDAALA